MSREQEFLNAARTGDQETFFNILNDQSININPDHTDKYGRTALILATENGQSDINRALIADPRIDLSHADQAKKAIKAKASYIAFGAFYQSKTKKTKHVASIKILKKVKNLTKTPIVAIGGINAINYKNLLLNKANFLAISGYIWKNKKYKPLQAIERLK